MTKVNLGFNMVLIDSIFLMGENRREGGAQNNILLTGNQWMVWEPKVIKNIYAMRSSFNK